MSWFGWLTKGHYEITFLDKITFFAELFLVLTVAVFVWFAYEKMKKKLKKKLKKIKEKE